MGLGVRVRVRAFTNLKNCRSPRPNGKSNGAIMASPDEAAGMTPQEQELLTYLEDLQQNNPAEYPEALTSFKTTIKKIQKF